MFFLMKGGGGGQKSNTVIEPKHGGGGTKVFILPLFGYSPETDFWDLPIIGFLVPLPSFLYPSILL